MVKDYALIPPQGIGGSMSSEKLWEIRVIILSQPRERVLYDLHTRHPGIVRMKSLARLHVWRPYLDRDIATIVRKCDNCQKSRNKPQPAPLHPWDWQKMPW